MARWRRLHGHLLRRRAMRELPLLPRELWKSLWVEEADDHGRCEAWPQALHGRLFSGSPDVTVAAVEAALDHLVQAGLLRRFAARGESYVVFDAVDWRSQGIDKPGEALCPCPRCGGECHIESCTCKRCTEHKEKDPGACRCRRCRPCAPGEQTELPFGAEGAKRGERRADERREGEQQPAGHVPGDVAAADAGAGAAPGGERGGGGCDAAGGAPAGGGGEAAGGAAPDGVDRAGERAGRDEAGPEEPAQGSEAGDFTGGPSRTTSRAELAIAPDGASGASAGSSPAASTTPPAPAAANSSATPAVGAGGLPAPQALEIFAEEAGDRWAPGRPALTATGLPHRQEADWLRIWTEARGAGYGAPELRQLGRALREGRLWRNRPPLSPGKLVEHFFDLMAEATAPCGSGPSRRENGFDQLLREEREADVIEVSVDE